MLIITHDALAAPPAVSPSNAAAKPETFLESLVPTHPRLLITNNDLQRTRTLIGTDSLAKQLRMQLIVKAQAVLAAPPTEYEIIGPRLLHVSRAVLYRVSLLAGLHQLHDDPRFAKRAIEEMLNAASFEDWNPSHFLDVAEMTAALAIGYDWLYEEMTPEQRLSIRQAIIEKGLNPGEKIYQNQEKRGWWVRGTNNWNQVCNAGMILGALAIAEGSPELAERILGYARESLPHAMNTFLSPNGGNEEGPGYWGYATLFTALYLRGMETALGTNLGFADAPGLADGGMFRIQTMGPFDWLFNYADGGVGSAPAPQMFYFAAAFDRPEYAIHERDYVARHGIDERMPILSLLWLTDPSQTLEKLDLPRSAFFDRVMVFTARSEWNNAGALFVGFKGGDNAASHAHLDLGTFVLDVLGERWAVDLGGDNYNLPGYFSKPKRWSYYRLGTPGHNTLTIDGENQSADAKAPIVAQAGFAGSADGAFAIADLTQAYAPKVKRAWRGIRMSGDGQRVLVQDEVEPANEASVTWNVHTRADIQLDDTGTMATLTQNGKVLHARIIDPLPAIRFEVTSADAPAPQAQQPDVRKLTISIKNLTQPATIAVQFSADAVRAETLKPLQQWGPGSDGRE